MIAFSVDARLHAAPDRNPRDALRVIHSALVLADIAAGAAFGALSVEAYFRFFANAAAFPAPSGSIVRELVLASIIAALVVRRPDPGLKPEPETARQILSQVLGRSLLCATILIGVGLATFTLHDMARAWLAMWGAAFFTWLCASRLFFLAYRNGLTQRGAAREGVVIIGTRPAITPLVERIRSEAHVVGVVDYPAAADAASIAKSLAGIIGLARIGRVGLVVLAHPHAQPRDMARKMVDMLKAVPVQVALSQELGGMQAASPALRLMAGVPLMLVADAPLGPQDLFAKMLLDKAGAALLLVLATPMLLAVAATVLLETPGPVLFRQERTGRSGKTFTVYKFRTMKHVPGQTERAREQTLRHDPRCTTVGSFLRRTSLDELPQLWNVLRGDMSLVGPRPHADALHARERSTLMTHYAQRHRVKPGLTGWAQVHGLRGAADTPEKLRRRVELDLYYIENWSLWLDLKILARTPFAVLSAENAF